MVRICSCCRLFLGLKSPVERWTVTHGVCEACRERFQLGASGRVAMETATLIVSNDPIGVEAASALIGRAVYPMVVLADRRRGDRRRRRTPVPVERRRGDRRTAPPASWARGYVVVETSTPDPELVALTLG